jgi:hypothetical protein
MKRFHSGVVFGFCLGVGLLIAGVSSTASAEQKSSSAWQAAPANIVQGVTAIPSAVFDQVGLQPTITPPLVLKSHSALRFNGKPGVYYLGAEPCPLCAAERWAFIAATSRFGRWSNLGITQSASDDVYPDTQSFTFARSSFSSPYMTVRTTEHLSNHKLANGRYATYQQLTAAEAAIYSRYDSARYFPTNNPGTYPFLDFGNHVVVAGPSYDPGILAGLSRTQIASDLSDPTSPIAKAIVGTANYLTAAICGIDNEKPTSVCTSSGVVQATHFDKVKPLVTGNCFPTPQKSQSVCGSTRS